jgi:ZIP family zinc transporter
VDDGFARLLTVATLAALASPAGGALALWRRPTTLFMSLALGFAGGVLLAAVGFEMLPQAMDMGSWQVAGGGFAAGFAAVYAFDLWIHRGKVAGEKAEQRQRVERFWRSHHPRGSQVTVLAGGTSAEELVEGVSIGVSAAIEPRLGALVALAILVDNLGEGLAIGELIRGTSPGRQAKRILGWTGLIGASLLVSTLAGWFFLRGLPRPVLGFLLASGAGGMFYLTITDLLPEGQERQYEQTAALAAGAGFLLVFVLSSLGG